MQFKREKGASQNDPPDYSDAKKVMAHNRVVAHATVLLRRIRDASATLALEVGSGTPLPTVCLKDFEAARDGIRQLASESADVIAQLGLKAAASSLDDQVRNLVNSLVELGLTEMAAAGEDANELRKRYGEFPLPHPDAEIETQRRASRCVLIAGKAHTLATFADSLIESLTGESTGPSTSLPEQPAGQQSTESVSPGPLPDFRHSADFQSVHWYGQDYSFTPLQAACVRVLWEHWEEGTPIVGQQTILDKADSAGNRLRDIFRKNQVSHAAWGTMIVQVAKGRYRLQEPSKS